MKSSRAILLSFLFGIAVVSIGYYLLFGKNKNRWIFSGGERNGHYDSVAKTIAEVFELESGRKILVEESSGSGENLKKLNQGLADVALLQNDIVGNDGVRAVAKLYSEVLHVIAREKDLKIENLHGKRISIGPSEGGTEGISKSVFRSFGIDFKKVQWRSESLADGLTSLDENRTDLLCVVTGIGNELLTQAMSKGKFHFIGLGENPSTRMAYRYPFVHLAEIPVGAYTTNLENEVPQKKIPTVGVNVILACRTELGESHILRLTSIIHEYRSTLVNNQPLMAELSTNNIKDNLQFSFHEGARQYYERDEPNFLQTWSEPMALILSVLAVAWGTALAIREVVLRKRKDSLDQYFQKVDILTGELINRPTEERIREISSDLNKIRKETIQKLIAEELAANESFVIFQRQLHTAQQLVSEYIRNQ